MVGSAQGSPPWMSAAASPSGVDFEANVSSVQKQNPGTEPISDAHLGFGERAFAAAGAAFISAILVNPLDVAKTRLQAQAAGVPYRGVCHMALTNEKKILPDMRSSSSCTHAARAAEPLCPPECSYSQYKGTMDVLYRVVRQEGFTRLWRGTNASLALAIPTVGIYLPCYDIFRNHMEEFTAQNAPNLTPYVPLVAGSIARSLACIACYPVELARTRMQAFKEITGMKPPGVRRTLLEVINPPKGANIMQNAQSYRIMWTGLGAQLARDVPFSAICWSTLEPVRRKVLGQLGDGGGLSCILWGSFSSGFVAGSLAAATTCPLDVAKTRQQIEKDPARALKMTTKQTLLEIWRDGGMKGLFTGIGPRVGRAGPSVGIVVSFYEIVKYCLHYRYSIDNHK